MALSLGEQQANQYVGTLVSESPSREFSASRST